MLAISFKALPPQDYLQRVDVFLNQYSQAVNGLSSIFSYMVIKAISVFNFSGYFLAQSLNLEYVHHMQNSLVFSCQ